MSLLAITVYHLLGPLTSLIFVMRALKNTKFGCRGVIYYAPTVAGDPPVADCPYIKGVR